MRRPPSRPLRLALALPVALLCAAAPATAGTGADPDPHQAASPHNWGTVIGTSEPAQATAWAMRALGRHGTADARIGETHHPTYPGVPDDYQAALQGPVEPGGDVPWFDHIEGVRTAAEPADGDHRTVTASVSVTEMEFGLPKYKAPDKPGPGATQRSAFGVLLHDVEARATSKPGAPPALSSSVATGHLAMAGKRIHSFDGSAAANTGVRVPKDPKLPPQLLATVNEQIGTDGQGHPNVTAAGGDITDKHALGGYVNALHLTILGPEPVDLTIGHAAVLRAGDGPR
ncbi:hypothetical protein ACFWZ2_31405 [Streptomyces sp. NPDC059002]|uniref:hypothetical protein n=1 Tax=Streptomyces sp. NPDC059002 TaxID=3346690 RepID=UPI00368F0833